MKTVASAEWVAHVVLEAFLGREYVVGQSSISARRDRGTRGPRDTQASGTSDTVLVNEPNCEV